MFLVGHTGSVWHRTASCETSTLSWTWVLSPSLGFQSLFLFYPCVQNPRYVVDLLLLCLQKTVLHLIDFDLFSPHWRLLGGLLYFTLFRSVSVPFRLGTRLILVFSFSLLYICLEEVCLIRTRGKCSLRRNAWLFHHFLHCRVILSLVCENWICLWFLDSVCISSPPPPPPNLFDHIIRYLWDTSTLLC